MLKKSTRKSTFGPINPTKSHFTKWLKKCQGAWLSEGEVVTVTLNSTVKEAKGLGKFKRHFPTELALAYGIKNELVTFKPTDDKRFTSVFLTPKGFNIVLKLFNREEK